MLRRTIHPQIRVLDEKQGIVEYVASDETLDSYNEIIRADGWRFDDFQKNAPFVDSHNYMSINSLLGKVIDFGVQGKELVETVQWAVDVGENALAQLGFKMTVAGYLRAVSVGFMPVRTVTPLDRDAAGWRATCQEMGMDPLRTDCRCVYLEQQQKELSTCVIGANPNALARSYAEGILTDSSINRIARHFPEFAELVERAIASGSRGRSPHHSTTNIQHSTFNSEHSTGNGSWQMEDREAEDGSRVPSPHQNATNIQHLTFNSEHSAESKTSTNTQTQNNMNSNDTLKDFSRLTIVSKGAIESIESARNGRNGNELEHSVRTAFAAVARERLAAYGNPVERYLNADPERRFFWNGMARRMANRGMKMDSPEYKAVQKAVSGINLQQTFGAGLLQAIPVAGDIYDLLLHYGQYKMLGLRKMVGQYTRFAEVTGYPSAIFITPSQQGQTTIPTDSSLTGTQVTPQANTIAALVEASIAWLADETVDLSDVLLSKFVQGLASRIDYGCFQGNGNDDTTNGTTVGLFNATGTGTYQAPSGETSIANLTRNDFINVTAQVAPAALQRMDEQPPRWYIHPALIPQLLLLKDGTGPVYLLKTPAETQGEWLLVGFPVTWAGQAPSASTAGSTIAVFGNPDAYLVGLHEQFEIALSDSGPAFGDASVYFRALGRGRSYMREATGFGQMQLAAH